MLHSKKNNMLSKILPVFDLFLLLILIMFSAGGLTQLKVNSKNEAMGKPDLLENIKKKVSQLQAERNRLLLELNAKKIEAARLEKELAALKQNSTSDESKEMNEEMLAIEKEKLQHLIDQIREQKTRLQNLDKKKYAVKNKENLLKEMQGRLANFAAQLREIDDNNKSLAEEMARIQREIVKRRNPVIRVESTPLMTLNTRRTPVYMALLKATVVPVREPFYRIREKIVKRGQGCFETVKEASWNKRGESIDQALKKGSVFSGLLEKIKPGEQYAALLVDSSSFETFRTLREVLRRYKIPFGWEPTSSTVFRFTPDGQFIGEEIE